MEQFCIGFIGAGAMAEALISGIIEAKLCKPCNIWVTNKSNVERLQNLCARWGVNAATGKREVLERASILVVAVKPKDVGPVLGEIAPLLEGLERKLVISVAAGIPIRTFENALPEGTAVVRAMPNTSCRVLESATAVARGNYVTNAHMAATERLFSCVGKVVEVQESMLDAVTGLSGSGPAYVYLLAEALIEAGLHLGLPHDITSTLALQTLYGAAKMLKETGQHPEVLRRQVTSPNGTTIAGLKALEEAGFTKALINAVQQATARSREMTQQFA
ncbi:MAG TPA: pyrroline-5-carboxylate reductase [Firmicutes bacterium]|nr:pyrroline-5-carboxylate reductase [Bacillota bacterium]